MATKRERSVAVKVSVDPRPAPTALPPVPPSILRPTPPPPRRSVKANVKERLANAAPVRAARQPVHDWPEAKRRQIMWWLVGGGMAVIVIGWLAVVRLELNGGSGQNLFTETKKLFSNFHLPGTPKPSAAEKEIRNLDTQVFPQFTK